MKAYSKTPIFNIFDLVCVGDYRSKVFKIITVMYEKSIDSFVYSIDNLYSEGYGHNCNKAFYREDELTEAIPEFAIGEITHNLKVTNIRYNDKIHEFEYEIFNEFCTLAKVTELIRLDKLQRGLIVKNGCTKGIILAIDNEHQVYCVVWENGNLSPYVPFDADYITLTTEVCASYNNILYDDTLYSSFFKKVYDDIINKRIN